MKRTELILYTFVILVLSSTCAHAQGVMSSLKDNAESMLVDAVQAYDSGDTKSAMARFSVISEAFPDNDAAHYYMALCHVREGEVKEAEAQLREAIRLDPHNYWYRDRLATLYAMSGQDAPAIEVYEGLVKDYPRKVDLLYSLVNLYARQENMDKVIETLDAIETMTGRDEQTAMVRYDILIRQDKAEEAFSLLKELEEEFPSPQVMTMMAEAMITQSRDSLAMDYYDKALSMDSEYAPALLGKSEVYRMRRSYGGFFDMLGRFTASASIPVEMKTQYLSNLTDHIDGYFFQTYQPQLDTLFETGVRVHPADSSMLLAAGTYYYRSDRRERGTELFKANSLLYPDNFNARAMYIQSLSYNDDWQALLEACEEAHSDFPDEPAFLNMRVMAYYNLGDMHSVIRECNRMAEEFKDDPDVVVQAWSTIGDTYYQLGNEKEAFKAYDKALKINPRYAPVLNNYAYYLSLKGKSLSKAASMSRITIEQEPDNATYLDTYGWILHLQKKSQDAKAYFKHAMLYGGKDSATILDHYAEVLYTLGEYDLAKVYWDMAIKKDTENEIPDLSQRSEEKLKAVGK